MHAVRLPLLLECRLDWSVHLIALAALSVLLASCGGGGGGEPPPPPPSVTYTAKSGVAQKGPLIKGSTVIAQELDASLSPTGKQYSYQTASDLGTFSPTSTFSSQYIGLTATGYYFDEVVNAVSTGTITLNGYSDLTVASVLNVNLLTTLAYQRIQHLVTGSNLTFAAATSQAENEVLAALNIPVNRYGGFGTLDLGGETDGDHILAAISSIFVYGNSAGPLSQLIANFQSDIGTNGVITSAATKSAVTSGSKNVNPVAVAANLTQAYSSLGVSFTPTNISDWIDQDGDGVIGKFKFQVPDATPSSVFTFPAFVVSQVAGTNVSVTGGTASVNGTPVTGTFMVQSGDVVAISSGADAFPNGVLSVYLINGTTRIARVSFLTSGVWYPTGSLSTARAYHSATLLPGGKVLVTGGQDSANDATAASELFDPVAGTWTPTGSLLTARDFHPATLLPNGKVLVTGGRALTAASELYDPATGTWTPTGSLSTARDDHTATLLPNGKVLVTGGRDSSGNVTAISELYDPAAGTWTPTGSLSTARDFHTATLLPSGKVLVTGGRASGTNIATSELYDPAAGTWTPTGSLSTARDLHTATLLPNGSVLLTGGELALTGIRFATSELYDPAAGTWTPTGSLSTARDLHTATLLPNGNVLVTGGDRGSSGSVTATSELYDPAAGTWTPAVSLSTPRAGHTATLLPNGVVLVAGGINSGVVASAELYR